MSARHIGTNGLVQCLADVPILIFIGRYIRVCILGEVVMQVQLQRCCKNLGCSSLSCGIAIAMGHTKGRRVDLRFVNSVNSVIQYLKVQV